MRSTDFERPIFSFTQHCLFSAVFVRHHNTTHYHTFFHDIYHLDTIEEYLKRYRDVVSSHSETRYVLDYLIDDLHVRGDTFFVFNTPKVQDHQQEDIIDLDDPQREELLSYSGNISGLKQHLERFRLAAPALANIHFIPPIVAKESKLSLTFILSRNNPRCAEIIEEILKSKQKLLAYIYEILAVLEAQLFVSQGMRTAVGAIMGRVNAHDFGHVLSHAQLDPDEAPEVREAYFKHLTNFLRSLMVFAAEVATTDPSWTMSLPFVAQIIHSFASCSVSAPGDWQGLPQGFERFPPSPVCRHLAQSEGVKRTRIRVLLDEREVEYIFEWKKGIARTICIMDTNQPSDILVCIPGGLIGAHALYCIFENVIRNGAKYGRNRGPELCLTVAVSTSEQSNESSSQEDSDQSSNLLCVRVWDDHSIYNADDYKQICRFFPPRCRPDEIRCADEHEDQWQITDDQGQLTSASGWGIKEMRIAAAWLRRTAIVESLGREEFKPFLFTPLLVDRLGRERNMNGEPKGSAHLHSDIYMGYQFYLMRPQDTVIVAPEALLSQFDKDYLKAFGIDVLSTVDNRVLKDLSHRCCLVYLPEQNAEKQLSFIEESRESLPAVLLLSGTVPKSSGPEPRISSAAFLGKNISSRTVKQFTQTGQLPMALLDGHQKWLEETLHAPQRLNLLLQLSASVDKETQEVIAQPWRDLVETIHTIGAPDFQWELHVGQEYSKPDIASSLLVYDYHGVWRIMNEGLSPYFYERFGGTQPAHTLLFNAPQDPWTRLQVIFGLIEAAIANVGLIDERLFGKYIKHANSRQTFAQAGIFLYSEKDFQEKPSEFKIEDVIQWTTNNRLTILGIHQGMLDKICKDRKEAEYYIEQIKEKVPFAVVQSDRGGLLPKLPRNARFVPFSSVQPWFTDQGSSKYFLVQTLLSGRSHGNGVK